MSVSCKDWLCLKNITNCQNRIAKYTEAGETAFMASRLIQDGVMRTLVMIG
jgi:uncharacterized protein with HEPN domain